MLREGVSGAYFEVRRRRKVRTVPAQSDEKEALRVIVLSEACASASQRRSECSRPINNPSGVQYEIVGVIDGRSKAISRCDRRLLDAGHSLVEPAPAAGGRQLSDPSNRGAWSLGTASADVSQKAASAQM